MSSIPLVGLDVRLDEVENARGSDQLLARLRQVRDQIQVQEMASGEVVQSGLIKIISNSRRNLSKSYLEVQRHDELEDNVIRPEVRQSSVRCEIAPPLKH